MLKKPIPDNRRRKKKTFPMFWSLQLPYRNVYSAAYDNGYENDFRLTLSFNTPYKYDYHCDYDAYVN